MAVANGGHCFYMGVFKFCLPIMHRLCYQVCLKIIKNHKDFFMGLDEIKVLSILNGSATEHHIVQLLDYFFYKEHIFLVSGMKGIFG